MAYSSSVRGSVVAGACCCLFSGSLLRNTLDDDIHRVGTLAKVKKGIEK